MVKNGTFLKTPTKFGGIKWYDVIAERRYDRCEAIYQHLHEEWKYVQ